MYLLCTNLWIYNYILHIYKYSHIYCYIKLILSLFKVQNKWFSQCKLICYIGFNFSMWWISSCGNPNSEKRSIHCCKRQLRLSDDPELRFFCVFVTFKSFFLASLQHSILLHPSLQQPDTDCSKSSSSMVSDTELTLGVGFAKALLVPSMIVSSYCETRCRSSVTEGGIGFSGCLVWYQKYRALWHTEAQRGSRVTYNDTEVTGKKSLQ